MLGALLQQTTLEITTTAGTWRLNLADLAKDDGSGPSLPMRILRPRVRLISGGTVVVDRAPAGAPEEGVQLRPILIAGGAIVAAGALVLLLRRLG